MKRGQENEKIIYNVRLVRTIDRRYGTIGYA